MDTYHLPAPTELWTAGAVKRYLEAGMNNIIYIIGLIVVIGAVLAFFGLR
jgi:hypothetical protein